MAERKNLLLRLDPAVHEALARWAADDLRSVNAQIEYALRLALRGAGREPRRSAPGAPAPDVGAPGVAAPDVAVPSASDERDDAG